MEIVNIYTDADAWFAAAESVQSTDELLQFLTDTFNYAPISEDFEENTDISAYLIDLTDELIEQKRMAELLEFEQLVKEKQKRYYTSEGFLHISSMLLEYHLFFQEEEKAKATFAQFVKNPNEDIDLFLPALNTIALYGKNEWVSEICAKVYNPIKECDEYFGDPEVKMSYFYYFGSLQKVFETQNIESGEDLTDWANTLLEYDIEISSDICNTLAKVLSTPWENLKMQKNESHVDPWLHIAFIKYMHETKNMSFSTSNIIYDLFYDFWTSEKKSKKDSKKYSKKYSKKDGINYDIDFDSMDEYFGSLTGFFNQYRNKGVAYVWSIPYVYDFLFSLDLIDSKLHQTAIDTGRKGRTFILGGEVNSSWKDGFIKYWEKADSISEEEHTEAVQKIDASFEHKYTKDYSKKENIWEDFMSSYEPSSKNYKPKPVLKEIPVRTDAKIGRNDPCTCGSGKKYKKCCG